MKTVLSINTRVVAAPCSKKPPLRPAEKNTQNGRKKLTDSGQKPRLWLHWACNIPAVAVTFPFTWAPALISGNNRAKRAREHPEKRHLTVNNGYHFIVRQFQPWAAVGKAFRLFVADFRFFKNVENGNKGYQFPVRTDGVIIRLGAGVLSSVKLPVSSGSAGKTAVTEVSLSLPLMFKHLFITILFVLLAVAGTQAQRKKGSAIPVNQSYREEILVTTVNGDRRGIYILNHKGDSITGKVFAVPVSNFMRWEYDGKIRYTYFLKDSTAYVNKNKPGVAGHFYVADTGLRTIRKFGLLPYGDLDTVKRQKLDVHDFILLSDDHYISLSYYQRMPDNIPAHLNPAEGVAVVSPVLQEVKNGHVIWQWEATKYPELYEVSVEENKFGDTSAAWDYLHVNSLSIDPKDNNIIMSFRNASQILKVDRRTGDIVWQLGGKQSDFHLADSMVFLRQHHAQYVDGGRSLILFDNGDEKTRKTSRIVEFELDERNHKIVGFHQFTLPDLFVPFSSSVQKIGDRYFIAAGNSNLIVEYNYKTGEKTFEKKLESASYRAFKY